MLIDLLPALLLPNPLQDAQGSDSKNLVLCKSGKNMSLLQTCLYNCTNLSTSSSDSGMRLPLVSGRRKVRKADVRAREANSTLGMAIWTSARAATAPGCSTELSGV